MTQAFDTTYGSTAASQASKGEETESSERTQADSKPCVLFVDDEKNIQSAVKRLLRRESYDVVIVGSGKEALEVLEKRPVDLILTDHRMPGMTGAQLLREVRLRWPETIRMILSGYAEVNAIIAAINEGEIYKYLTKPWNDEEIKLDIRRALEQRKLEAENERLTCEIKKQNDELRGLTALLDEQAKTADLKLSLSQEILEVIDVGVLSVNCGGIVISANRCVSELLFSGTSEIVGSLVWDVVPEELRDALFESSVLKDDETRGCVKLGRRTLQWRFQRLGTGPAHWGMILTFWEEIPHPGG